MPGTKRTSKDRPQDQATALFALDPFVSVKTPSSYTQKSKTTAKAVAFNIRAPLYDDDSVEALSSDTDADVSKEPPAKKAKTNTKKINDIQLVTAYINIIHPAHSGRLKPTIQTDTPPFSFSVDDSYAIFLDLLASAASPVNRLASRTAITTSKLFWKKASVASDSPKSLANEIGYKAMIDTIQSLAAKKGTAVAVFLPPLTKTVKKRPDSPSMVTSGAGDDDEVAEEDPGSYSASLRAQKGSLNMSTATTRKRLESIYPVGTHWYPPWKEKRIYTTPNGDMWGLDSLALTVWARTIDEGETTAEKPPFHTLFSASKRLQLPRNAVTSTPLSQNEPPHPFAMPPFASSNTHPNPNPNPFPYGHPYLYPLFVPPYGYPPFPLSYPSATSASHMHLPYQSMNPAAAAAALPQQPFEMITNKSGSRTASLSSAPSSPPKLTLKHHISLEEFCACFGISDEDLARLAKLSFVPGDRRFHALEREEWQGFGGFSKIGWEDFLLKHKEFVREVKDGNPRWE